MSMASRLGSTPLFFLGKVREIDFQGYPSARMTNASTFGILTITLPQFLWNKFRNPSKCSTIKIPLAREFMRKGDLGERALLVEVSLSLFAA